MPKSAQGVNHDRYQVIPRTLTFIVRGHQVLLIKGAPNKRLWPGLYNGVGGHIEKGEDVLTAAKRELKEEAGIEARNMRLCGIILIDVEERTGVAVYVFQGEYFSGELIQSEEGTLEWVDLARVNAYPVVEDLPVLLKKTFESHPGGYPFSALYHYDSDDQLVITFGE